MLTLFLINTDIFNNILELHYTYLQAVPMIPLAPAQILFLIYYNASQIFNSNKKFKRE
jgi:hypothetical protein